MNEWDFLSPSVNGINDECHMMLVPPIKWKGSVCHLYDTLYGITLEKVKGHTPHIPQIVQTKQTSPVITWGTPYTHRKTTLTRSPLTFLLRAVPKPPKSMSGHTMAHSLDLTQNLNMKSHVKWWCDACTVLNPPKSCKTLGVDFERSGIVMVEC